MIKVGIIGAGRIGHVHGESISKFVKHAEVKTVADPFMNEKTEAWAKSLGIQKTTKDFPSPFFNYPLILRSAACLHSFFSLKESSHGQRR